MVETIVDFEDELIRAMQEELESTFAEETCNTVNTKGNGKETYLNNYNLIFFNDC